MPRPSTKLFRFDEGRRAILSNFAPDARFQTFFWQILIYKSINWANEYMVNIGTAHATKHNTWQNAKHTNMTMLSRNNRSPSFKRHFVAQRNTCMLLSPDNTVLKHNGWTFHLTSLILLFWKNAERHWNHAVCWISRFSWLFHQKVFAAIYPSI